MICFSALNLSVLNIFHNECMLFYNIKTQNKRCISKDFVARVDLIQDLTRQTPGRCDPYDTAPQHLCGI